MLWSSVRINFENTNYWYIWGTNKDGLDTFTAACVAVNEGEGDSVVKAL